MRLPVSRLPAVAGTKVRVTRRRPGAVDAAGAAGRPAGTACARACVGAEFIG